MSKKETTGKGRTRNFATVVYPESAPCNWIDILTDEHIPCFISPLHDKDENPGGESKKEHYHVMIMFEGVKTIEQSIEIFNKINGVGCEVVKSLRGYARYLCHLDNPEKAQYNPDEVKMLCGADYYNAINLVIDKYKAIQDMIEFCVNNDVRAYSELLEYCSVNRFDWFRVLCDCGTVVMKEYLKSREWKRKTDYFTEKEEKEKGTVTIDG